MMRPDSWNNLIVEENAVLFVAYIFSVQLKHILIL
jgi:hypothetical protein